MPRPYEMPVINGTTDLFTYSNEVTEGWMSPLFLIASVIIFFIIFKQRGYRTPDCLMGSSFITFLLSSLMWAAGFLPGKICVLFLLLTAISSMYATFTS